MPRWRRDESRDEIEVAAGTPDAVAVLDAHGNVIGWDESAACAYLAANGLPCDADCQARGHINPL